MFSQDKPIMMNKNQIYKLLILFVLSVSISCKDSEGEYHSVVDKIEHKSKGYHGVLISSDNLLEGTDLIKITEGEHTFMIPERKGKIKSYSCTECHSKPLNEIRGDHKSKKAHWDIKLAHANTNAMNCATCHNGNDMDNLATITGKKVDFNKSYLLCAQCHSSQFDDWKGGAHGKKVAGWAPPRASMTCVNCHNPHQPHFEKKWPARLNTQKIKERKDQLGH